MQVIEGHMVRGLEDIFAPVVVQSLEDAKAERWASGSASVKCQRAHLEGQVESCKRGRRYSGMSFDMEGIWSIESPGERIICKIVV